MLTIESYQELKLEFVSKIQNIKTLKDLEELRVEFIGKNGYITQKLEMVPTLALEQRKDIGKSLNILRTFMLEQINAKQMQIETSILEARFKNEQIDVSLPARQQHYGKQHIISHVISELAQLFACMGYTMVHGPEIEDDWHNFSALNTPPHHPARELQDTFYTSTISLENNDMGHFKSDKILLRTHTSSVQIRHMMNNKPPFYIVSIGKVYRSDYDATHAPMFHQLECLCIDKDITFGHMKGVLQTFINAFFNTENAEMRLRSSYFPFVEPGAEVDIQCDLSQNNIQIGKGRDWLEILGCGMVHRNVLANVGIAIKDYQGFAFGVGIERLAMLKYNISDLRNFFDNDMRWLAHYGCY